MTILFLMLLLLPRLQAAAPPPTPGEPPLVLTATIVSMRYCVGDEEIDWVQFRADFAIRNRGETPIVLRRGGRSIPHIESARTIEDLRAKRFESHTDHDIFTMPSSRRKTQADFVVLQPGEAYQFTGDFSEVAASTKAPIRVREAVLGSGSHLLRVQVSNSDLEDGEAKYWSEHFERIGRLWLEPLLSEPIPIEIAEKRLPANCESPSH